MGDQRANAGITDLLAEAGHQALALADHLRDGRIGAGTLESGRAQIRWLGPRRQASSTAAAIGPVTTGARHVPQRAGRQRLPTLLVRGRRRDGTARWRRTAGLAVIAGAPLALGGGSLIASEQSGAKQRDRNRQDRWESVGGSRVQHSGGIRPWHPR